MKLKFKALNIVTYILNCVFYYIVFHFILHASLFDLCYILIALILLIVSYISLIYKMLQEAKSIERQFHRESLFEKLRKIRQTLSTSNLYLEERAQSIIWSIFSSAEMFGTGLVDVFTRETLKQREIGKAVVIAVMDETGQAEIQSKLPSFSDIFILNLTVSTKEAAQSVKVSPIRKKLRGFLEISLNFYPFIDTIYIANRSKRKQASFVEAFTSYLVSLPKFHQFQISFSKTQNNNSLATSLDQILKGKLQILERHNSTQLKESGSPRINIFLIDRKIDVMSPLIYSYFYGPIAQELQLLDDHSQLTTKSMLYATLFSMDIQEARQLLTKLSSEKADIKKATIDNSQVQQIKKAITVFCDRTASSKEIAIHIDSLTTIQDFCKRRAVTTALQQTILNNRSEADEKMSPSKIIDRIIEWANLPLQEFKSSEQDYIKMLILAYMVNSFWFFQRKIINAGLEGQRKDQIISFCKRVQNTYKPLSEKQQGEERYDLYRHQPAIINQIDAYMTKSREFQVVNINKSSANRQNNTVIAVNGPLGYNEACFIKRYFKEKHPNVNVTIFCERLMNTKQYLNHMLRQQN